MKYSLLVTLIERHLCSFHREKEKVAAKVGSGPQSAPSRSPKGQQQAPQSRHGEENTLAMIHMQNLKVAGSTLCVLVTASSPPIWRFYICMCMKVFTEALLHLALNCAGPAAADGEDAGPPPLEAEAASVACLAGGGVGRADASRGRESRAGAA